jgi:hypothetical protein
MHNSGKNNLLSRGCWAGDCFAFWDARDINLKAFTNVSEDICQETRALWASKGMIVQPSNIWPLSLDGLWTDISDGMKREKLSNQVGLRAALDRFVPHSVFPPQQSQAIHQNLPSLPLEIFGMIFRFTLGATEEGESESGTVVACSHVCRLWRNMTIGDPRLWCILESDQRLSQTKTFLARSQTEQKLPLHVIIYTYGFHAQALHNSDDDEGSDVSQVESNMSYDGSSGTSEDGTDLSVDSAPSLRTPSLSDGSSSPPIHVNERESIDEVAEFISLVVGYSDRWASVICYCSRSDKVLNFLGDGLGMLFPVCVSL